MPFFSQLTSKVTNVSNQLAGKAKNMSDTSRLEQDIKSLNLARQNQFTAIGKAMYDYVSGGREGDEPDYSGFIASIDDINRKIDENTRRIEEIRSQIVCPDCGKSIPAGSETCPFCGAYTVKPAVQPAEAAAGTVPYYEQPPVTAADVQEVLCPHCGARVRPGDLFCMSCGSRLDGEGPQTGEEIQ